jgi:hypothetical protein
MSELARTATTPVGSAIDTKPDKHSFPSQGEVSDPQLDGLNGQGIEETVSP